jgi:hypothetical protein
LNCRPVHIWGDSSFFLDILLLKQQFSLAWAILVAFGKMHQKRL